MSFEKCWIGGKAPKIQRSSCTPWWYCKRRLWFLRSIHWTRIFSISNDSRQDHGYHLQIARLRWTSSRRSIRLYPGENGRCLQIVQNSQIGVSRQLDSSTTTQMAKIMVQYGRPSRSSWAKSVRSSSGRTIMGKATRESYIGTRWWKSSKLGMFLCKPRKKTILVCVCGWFQNWLERNKTLTQCGKYWWKTLIWENRHHSVTMFILGCTQRECQTSQYIEYNTEICLNPKSLLELWKSYQVQGHLTRTFPHGPMTWKVMQRNA